MTKIEQIKAETPLKLKYKKETDKDLAHTDVYHGEEFLGYLIKNTSFTAEVNENWNWCGKDHQYFHARTRKELVELIRINYVLN